MNLHDAVSVLYRFAPPALGVTLAATADFVGGSHSPNTFAANRLLNLGRTDKASNMERRV